MKIGGSTLLPAICLAGRCLHPRCGADGVHGPWRRIPATSSAGFTGQASFGFTSAARRADLEDRALLQRQGQQPARLAVRDPWHRRQDRPGAGIRRSASARIRLLRRERADLLGPLPADVVGAVGLPVDVPKTETSTSPLCRFEVIVRDNDQNLSPSPGDFFSIKLSTVTCASPTDVSCSNSRATVFYARAGT